MHTSIGPMYRERMSGSPQTLPRSSQPQRLLGRQACSVGALRGLLTTVVFSPQQGFEAAPRHLRQSAKAAAAGPGPPHPVHLTSLSSIVSHGSPGRGGGGGGGPGWPCSDPSPPGPGTPLTVLNGPILALDADLDVYAVVTYQLLGAQSGLFDIDNSTGEASHTQHSRLPTAPIWGRRGPGLGLGPPLPSWVRAPGAR